MDFETFVDGGSSQPRVTMDFDTSVDDGSFQPSVTRLRTGMFSAEDGLMLAVFFSVVVLVALVVRCICVRCCHVQCSKCQHKQDPATHDDTLSSVVVGSSRRQSQSSTQHPSRRAEPEMIDVALLDRTFGVDSCSSNACSLAETSSDGATCNSLSNGGSDSGKPRVDPCHSCKRGRRVSLVPPASMETLFEEEEGEDPLTPSSRRFLEGAASRGFPKETGVVYTIYTFPHGNNSPEVLRTSTTKVTSLSSRARAEAIRGEIHVPSTSSNTSGRPSDFDLPSYDELFPLPRSSEENSPQSRNSNKKTHS